MEATSTCTIFSGLTSNLAPRKKIPRNTCINPVEKLTLRTYEN